MLLGSPDFFLTDFSKEEINAIKQTFTGRELIIKIENALVKTTAVIWRLVNQCTCVVL